MNKRRLLWCLFFFIVPTFIVLLVVLGVMNSLLEQGIGAAYWILGSPVIVTIWTTSVVILLLTSWRHLYKPTLETSSTFGQAVKPNAVTPLVIIPLLFVSTVMLRAQPNISAILTPPEGPSRSIIGRRLSFWISQFGRP